MRATGPILAARSQGWAATLGGVVGLAIIADLAASWLASRPYFAGSEARVPVIALVPVAASAFVGVSLGSRDVDLDRSTPHPWPAKRVRDVLGWTVLTGVTLAATVAADPRTFGSIAMARNVLGYFGLACLAATLLGAALSWLPGIVLSGTLYLAAPRSPTGADQLWAWSMSAGQLDTSFITPCLLFLTGLVAYAHFGPRAIPGSST